MSGERRRHAARVERRTALLLGGPIAIAGVIAGGWSSSALASHPAAASVDPMTAAGAAHSVGQSENAGTTPIMVRVRLSSPLAAQLARDAITVTLPWGATVGQLLNELAAENPVLAAMGPSVMIALSGSMALPDTVIVPGETVELMSPFAGG